MNSIYFILADRGTEHTRTSAARRRPTAEEVATFRTCVESLSTFLLHGQLAQGNEADQEGGRRMTLDRVYSGGSRQSCTGQNKMEMMGVAGSDRRSSRMRIDQTRPRQPAMNSKHNLQESLKCEAQQTYPPRNWNIVFCTGSNPDTCAELPRKIISRRSSWLLTLTGR